MSGSRKIPDAVTRCSPGACLLVVLGALFALDSLILVSGVGVTRRRSTTLDAAIGGFVLGHSVSTAWSFHGFDLRGVQDCESELFPIIGAPCCDPGHRASHDPSAVRLSEHH
jgi:hypothetical protein